MALTIYGSPRSRTLRTLWTAAELGLDYQHVPLVWDDPYLKNPAFLRLNPAGTIPTIDHDGFGLGESLAINLYLAKTFGSVGEESPYPRSPQGEAEAWRWTLWAQAHLEPWVRRDGGRPVYQGPMAEVALTEARAALAMLDGVLSTPGWLVEERFTVADLNVACVLSPSRTAALDMASYPSVSAWLSRCYGRPAAMATRARFAS